jgi:hypothetical protein
MKSPLVSLFILITSFYVVVTGVLYVAQSSFIFFPRSIAAHQISFLNQFKENEIKLNHEGVSLHGWFIQNASHPESPLIIYYGGNAEEVSQNLHDLDKFGDYSMLFMNYRGYGKSEGRPSQYALFADALFIFDHFSDQYQFQPENIIIMGRSLGSAVAVHVAGQRQVKAMVLVTPFDNLVNVAKKHYPIFPIKLLLRHPFLSDSIAPNITCPMLAVMGKEDRIIPNDLSMNLVEKWGGKRESIILENVGHNTISFSEEYWVAIQAFLSK